MAHIRDGVKKHQREKEEREKTEAAIAGLQRMQQQQCRLLAASMTPVSAISQAMQSTTLGGQCNTQSEMRVAPQTTTNNMNPFTSQSGGQGTLFRLPKGGAGFESAISGWLVSPAVRLLNLFYFMYQF